MKLKISKRGIILLVILLLVLALTVWISSRNNNNNLELFTVQKGTVQSRVEETGTVKKGERIDLSFKVSGRIEDVSVSAGDKVAKGEVLASIDNSGTYYQLQQAKANLELAQAELKKLLAGASKEEIQVAKTQVSSAENVLESEKQDLKNVQKDAEQDLTAVYEDSYNTLDDAYLVLYNAYVIVDSIQRTYFINNDIDSVEVRNARTELNNSLIEMKSYLDLLETGLVYGDVDTTLAVFKKELSEAKDYLSTIKNISEKPVWRDDISSTDKTSLDTSRSNVITIFSEVVNAEQSISSTKITNQTNIDTAKSAVSKAEDSLDSAKDNLALVLAGPTDEEVELYEAKVESAQAEVNRLTQLLSDTKLRSPVDGEVIEVHKHRGEVVSATTPIFTILPDQKLNVEVDIYEEDVVKIEVGDQVLIDLVAFPDKTFSGVVTFIEPAEKLVDQVVYYETKLGFDDVPDKIKPGMTADVSIITDSREGVLIIPDSAVYKSNGKDIVKVYKAGEIEEREVTIGLKGTDNNDEVVSGLQLGEQVVVD